jgi:hypothetical protein
MENKELSIRIYKFLDLYAKKDQDGEWSSPDAYELEKCAILLKDGEKIKCFPWSEWGSGGYHPYTSLEGRMEHDFLMGEIQKILWNNNEK